MLVAMKAQNTKRGVMSPSLLENIPGKWSKDAHKRMCLGMGEWTESSSGEEKENALPSRKPSKELRLSKKKPSSERWHFISDDEEDDLSKKFVPKNTKWALAYFNTWRQSRNKRFSGNPEKQVPGNFLEGTDDPAALCKWLTLYVAETRKQDGSKYSLKILYSLSQMNFAGCSIVIYQGNSAPAVPTLPPRPMVSDHELDDLFWTFRCALYVFWY